MSISLHIHFTFRKFLLSKCSSRLALFIYVISIRLNNCGKKITQFKRSSEKTCPTENDYCSLFCIQFHYNSTFTDEIFCGYSIEAACDFGASQGLTTYFVDSYTQNKIARKMMSNIVQITNKKVLYI